MERLWAPWRMEYIAEASGKRAKKAKCLFCSLGRAKPGPGNLVLARTPQVLVMLNLYPYNVGHVMVAPIRHRGSLAKLAPEESLELTEWLGHVVDFAGLPDADLAHAIGLLGLGLELRPDRDGDGGRSRERGRGAGQESGGGEGDWP